MTYLVLDTNIVSYFMESKPLADTYRSLVHGHVLAISFMTVAELYRGALWARWGKKRLATLREVIDEYEVLYSSIELSQWWSVVRYQRRAQPISPEDAWIAATALAYGLPLATHNAADFQDIPDLRLITANSS